MLRLLDAGGWFLCCRFSIFRFEIGQDLMVSPQKKLEMRSRICQIVDRTHQLTSDIVGLILDTILGARCDRH
ncbi:hypothetical protein [Microcoleus sp. Aus8_D3]